MQYNLFDEFKDEVELGLPTKTEIKYGDIFQLGKHRLMCGDSTKGQDVSKLMNGIEADLIFTDPPYNVDYVGKTNALKIMNDKMSNDNFYNFLFDAFKNMFENTKKGGVIYVCHADLNGLIFRKAFQEAGFKLAACLIWVKKSLVLGRQDYHWQHEPILYGWKEGAAHYFVNDRTQTTVWKIPRPTQNSLHPTMKPVVLCARAIKNSSLEGDVVLDLFGGSGSTLIACEQEKRVCYMMELDPFYVQAIINRWEIYTRKKVIKI